MGILRCTSLAAGQLLGGGIADGMRREDMAMRLHFERQCRWMSKAAVLEKIWSVAADNRW